MRDGETSDDQLQLGEKVFRSIILFILGEPTERRENIATVRNVAYSHRFGANIGGNGHCCTSRLGVLEVALEVNEP